MQATNELNVLRDRMQMILLVALLSLLSVAAGSAFNSNCGQQDIVFLIDSSGSISKANFDAMKEFIIALMERIGGYGDNGIRVAVVVFAKYTNLKTEFGLDEYNTMQEVIDAIRAIAQFSPGQTTHLYHAIATSLPELMEKKRDGAQVILIILTDGKAKDQFVLSGQFFDSAFEEIGSNNAKVLPVGISDNLDKEQLKLLAGPNSVIYAEDYNLLLSHLSELASQTCPPTQTTTSTSPTTSTTPPQTTTVTTTSPTTSPPSNCGQQDIVFLIDSSGSISKANFDAMKEFIIALMERIGGYGDNGIRVAVVVFAKYTNLKTEFGLDEYNTMQEVIDAIRAIAQFSPGQTTHLYHAIATSLPELMEKKRDGAQVILIILTDGKAKDQFVLSGQFFDSAFEEIGSNNAKVLPVGISDNLDKEQLKLLAGPNSVIYAEDYNLLLSHLSELASQTCPPTQTTTSTSPTTSTTPPQTTTVTTTSPTTSPPSNCGQQDIVFLIDSSGSISKANFDAMKEFIIALMERIGGYGDNGIRVAVVVFAKYTNLKTEFGLDEYNTMQEVIDAIRAIAQFSPGQTTHLYHAIATSLPELMEKKRDGAQVILIILTDGKAKDQFVLSGQFFDSAFEEIGSNNAKVLPVGISDNLDKEQLKLLAGPNSVIYAEDYNLLLSHLSELASQTCPPTQTTTSTSPTTSTTPPQTTTVTTTSPTTSPPSNCGQQDIVFLIDSSGSISKANFDAMKEFIIALMERIGGYGDNGIRVAVVVFAKYTNLKTEFGLDEYNTMQEVIDAIRAIAQFSPGQTTHLYHAIATSLPELMEKKRDGAQVILIILTDGKAKDQFVLSGQFFDSAFDEIGSNNAKVLPVGISDNLDKEQLKLLAGPNSVIYAEDYNLLLSHLSELASQTCPPTQTTTSTSPTTSTTPPQTTTVTTTSPTTSPPSNCGQQDIVFLIDSSGSISKANFDAMKEFIIALMERIGGYGDNGIRVAVVVFAKYTNLKTEFGLDEYNTMQEVIDAIRAIAQFSPGQTTHLYHAIATSLPELMEKKRDGAQVILIILTDGKAKDQFVLSGQFFDSAFEEIGSNNAKVLPVGISDNLDKEQLKLLAGPNSVIYAEDYNLLLSHLSELASQTCPPTQTTTSTSPTTSTTPPQTTTVTTTSPTTSPPSNCGQQDIVFLIDSSGSISKANFDAMKEFIIALMERIGGYGDNGIRVAVVVFAKYTNLKTEFGLDEYNTMQEVIDAIRAIAQFSPGQTTHLYHAIATSLPELMEKKRDGAQVILIILTDGKAKDQFVLSGQFFDSAFEEIGSNNAKVLPVGISDNLDKEQLKLLAGPNSVIYAEDYNLLLSHLSELASQTCPPTQTTTSTSPTTSTTPPQTTTVTTTSPTTSPPSNCGQQDIVFLIDSSGSISKANFDAMKEFIIALMERIGGYGDNGIRVAVVVFAKYTNLKTEFGLDEYNTMQEVIDAIRAIAQFSPGQTTHLYHAIATSLPELMEKKRDGAQVILIILTDGKAKDQFVLSGQFFDSAFEEIGSNNAKVLPVGISDNLDKEQLKLLAGPNSVIYAEDYNLLLSHLSELASQTCPPTQTTTSTSPTTSTTPPQTTTVTTTSPTTSPPSNCGQQDIVFLIDSSGSISKANFDAMKEFIIALMERIGGYGDNGIRVAVVVFAKYTNLKTEFGLDEYNTMQEVIDAIRAIAQFSPGQTTHLYHAIATSLPELMEKKRDGAQVILIILTDGKAKDQFVLSGQFFDSAFEEIGSNNAKVLPVGISDNLDKEQLKLLAGPNSVIYAEDYNLLLSHLSELASQTCPPTQTTTSTSPTTSTTPPQTTTVTTTSPTTSPPSNCGQQDIVFLIDSSGSISKANFDAMKEFIIALMERIGGYGDNGIRVAVVVFAKYTNLKTEFGLDEYNTMQEVIDAIRAIAQFSPGQTTHLYHAIATSLPELMEKKRDGAQVILIILTDGKAKDQFVLSGQFFDSAFEEIGSNNAKVLPVGISDNLDKEQLKLLAGPNSVIYAEDYNLLLSHLSELASQTCPPTQTTTSTSPTTSTTPPQTTTVTTTSPTTSPPSNCGQQDIVFLIDSSGSISKANFDAMKEFIIALMERIGGYGDNGIRVAVVVFAKYTNLKTEFGLDEYNTMQEVIDAIRAIAQFSPGQTTHLYHAIATSLPELMEKKRDGAQVILIILTDGKAKDQFVLSGQFFDSAFEEIGSNNAKVLPVGISDNLDKEQLKLLAGPNSVIYAEDYNLLLSHLSELASQTCPPTQTTTSTSPTTSTTPPQTTTVTTTSPTTSPPSNCGQQDIVFLIDSSGSISKANFDAMKEFIIALMERIGGYGDNGIRVAVVVFAKYTNLKTEFGLDEYNTMQEVIDAIRAIAQFSPGQTTHLYHAIATSLPELMEKKRDGAQVILIILTDGKAKDQFVLSGQFFDSAFEEIGSNNAKVLPVGISDNLDKEQLKLLAGPNSVIYAEDYNLLLSHLSELASQTCPPTQTTTSTSPTTSTTPPQTTTVTTTSPTTSPPSNCGQQDIVFLIDSSGSISKANFDAMKEFIIALMERIGGYGDNGIRVAVVVFAKYTNLKTEFGLDEYNTMQEVIDAIRAIAQFSPGQTTHLYHAIATSLPELMEKKRDGAQVILIILTDGKAKDQFVLSGQFFDSAFEEIGSNNATVLPVGISDNLDKEQLKLLAGPNSVIYAEDYNLLLSHLSELAGQTCAAN
ncbi:collagen alpha-3(VI) chain-like [Lineus longissimus]|uniref:collagen alpha-3(VI) chain-like n=1 Tax=Lineus longissimus TaxID=88925 RepID=UPI00315D725E